MPASGEPASTPETRLRASGLELPPAPRPLGAYVESAQAGPLLFISGTLPVVKGVLAIGGRLGENLSTAQGAQAARLAALNALAAAREQLGSLDRIRKLAKLRVLMTTTEQFTEHAAVGDGASNLFAQIFGQTDGHVRVVYGVQSMPLGAPVMVETVFELH
jgi:enamine deaminase RidA (YjgF/YER057c/UK114 family)